MSFKEDMGHKFSAGFSIFYIETHEEPRVIEDVENLSMDSVYNCFQWKATTGMLQSVLSYKDDKNKIHKYKLNELPTEQLTKLSQNVIMAKDMKDPLQAIQFIENSIPERSVVILPDFYHFFTNVMIVRKLKDIAQHVALKQKRIIFVGCKTVIPDDIRKLVTVANYELPTVSEISNIVQTVEDLVAQKKIDDPELRESIVNACKGMGVQQLEDALALAYIEENIKKDSGEKGWSKGCIQTILNEKAQEIKKSDVLEYIEVKPSMSEVGGMKNLINWIRKRKKSMTKEAIEFGVEPSKGICLLGPPGCGKSLVAKACASELNVALLKCDMGNIYRKFVGESQERMLNALKLAKAQAPCCLWFDEFDRQMGAGSSEAQESHSVNQQVQAILLNWLQENRESVFVIATGNYPHLVDPAMLQRFSAVWFCDLPTEAERRDIFAIHINKRKRNPMKFDLVELGKKSDGMVGREIEKAVVDGIINAFDAEKELSTEFILEAMSTIKPSSQNMSKNMESARDMLKNIAMPASMESQFKINIEKSSGRRKIEN